MDSIKNPLSGKNILVSGKIAREVYKLYLDKKIPRANFKTGELTLLKKFYNGKNTRTVKKYKVGGFSEHDPDEPTKVTINEVIKSTKPEYIVLTWWNACELDDTHADALKVLDDGESFELLATYHFATNAAVGTIRYFDTEQVGDRDFSEGLHDALMIMLNDAANDDLKNIRAYALIRINKPDFFMNVVRNIVDRWEEVDNPSEDREYGTQSQNEFSVKNTAVLTVSGARGGWINISVMVIWVQ